MDDMGSPRPPRPVRPLAANGSTSLFLLERARAGDPQATNELLARYLPRLERWTTGRLPPAARSLCDTHDVVQDTLIRAFKGLARFEVRGEGALGAYLRQAVNNRIKDEIRRMKRQPRREPLQDWPAAAPSPLEQAIGTEAFERYERALWRLKPSDREAVIASVELNYTLEELAGALEKPTVNAARQAVSRALSRLAKEMSIDEQRVEQVRAVAAQEPS
jgi:RNA polymerase sigma factor (sigma-70 family)